MELTTPMREDAAFIRLTNVSKVYRMGTGAVYALRDITLQIPAGQYVAVIGPSGSGKSTLLNLLAGIDRPTTGRVVVADAPLNEMDEDALARWRGAHIGLVFQFFQLLPTLTALENVVLPMDLRGAHAGRRRERAMRLLERVGMAARADHLPAELSGGEQQRVAIARALANDPPILLADEPTGNLDTANAAQVIALLAEIHRDGKTVVLITHEQRLAAAAQRRIRMMDGRIVEDTLEISKRSFQQSAISDQQNL